MALLKYIRTTCFVTAASTILLATGCQSPSDSTALQQQESDTAHAQNEISETKRLEHTQMAAGARADCTLYSCHFDGSSLDSLGTTKLDLMLADSHSNNPIVIYMDVPEDNFAQDRRLAIGRYLEDRGGLKAEQIEFHSGPNPETYNAADLQLGYMVKTDTNLDGESSGSSGSSSGSAGSSSGGSTGH